jgi:hypothetical protein
MHFGFEQVTLGRFIWKEYKYALSYCPHKNIGMAVDSIFPKLVDALCKVNLSIFETKSLSVTPLAYILA